MYFYVYCHMPHATRRAMCHFALTRACHNLNRCQLRCSVSLITPDGLITSSRVHCASLLDPFELFQLGYKTTFVDCMLLAALLRRVLLLPIRAAAAAALTVHPTGAGRTHMPR